MFLVIEIINKEIPGCSLEPMDAMITCCFGDPSQGPQFPILEFHE